MSIVREDEVLPRIRRQPGDYLSQEVAVPAAATYVTAVVDSRGLWTPRAAREIVLSITIEAFIDNAWVVLGGFTTDASEKLSKIGTVLDASSVRVRLPRTRAGQPPVRSVLQCASACTGAVRLVFEDTPLPVRLANEHHSVTYDNDNEAVGIAVTSVTIGAFAVGNNLNRCMVVGVGRWDSSLTDSLVSTINHNGSTAGWTQAILQTDGLDNRASISWKVAPTVVSATVVVTMGGACESLAANALSVWDVDQTTPIAGGVGADGSGSPATVNVTAATGDLVYDVAYSYGQGATYLMGTAGASQTARASAVINDYGTSGTAISASTEPGATTTTMSWTASVGTITDWVQAAVAIKAAAAAGHPAIRRLGSIGYGPRRASRNMRGVH